MVSTRFPKKGQRAKEGLTFLICVGFADRLGTLTDTKRLHNRGPLNCHHIGAWSNNAQ